MEDVGASCATALGLRSWDQQDLFLRVYQEVRGLGVGEWGKGHWSPVLMLKDQGTSGKTHSLPSILTLPSHGAFPYFSVISLVPVSK